MEIIIKGEAKEIAALLIELEEWRANGMPYGMPYGMQPERAAGRIKWLYETLFKPANVFQGDRTPRAPWSR